MLQDEEKPVVVNKTPDKDDKSQESPKNDVKTDSIKGSDKKNRKPRNDKGKSHTFKVVAKTAANPNKHTKKIEETGTEIVNGETVEKTAGKDNVTTADNHFNIKLAIGIGALVLAGFLFLMFAMPRNSDDENDNSVGGFNIDRAVM